jgi:hypothetical protein
MNTAVCERLDQIREFVTLHRQAALDQGAQARKRVVVGKLREVRADDLLRIMTLPDTVDTVIDLLRGAP